MNSSINVLLVKLIAFFTLVWFFAIPSIEVGISNISDAYHNKTAYKENMGAYDKYKELSTQDKYELMWELLVLEKAQNEAFENIDIDNINKAELSLHIEAFSLLLVPDYKMEIMDSFYFDKEDAFSPRTTEFVRNALLLEGYYIGYSDDAKEMVRDNINSQTIEKLMMVSKSNTYLNPENLTLTGENIKRVGSFLALPQYGYNYEKIKIPVNNKELVELVSVIGHEKGKEGAALKFDYGSTFLILSVLFFMVCVVIMQICCASSSRLPQSISDKLFDNLGESTSDAILMLKLSGNILVVIVTSGFFNIALNIYLKEIGEIGEIGFWNLFWTPMFWLIYNLGDLYVSNIPLSRFVLFAAMPIALSIHWFLISKQKKLIKLYEE